MAIGEAAWMVYAPSLAVAAAAAAAVHSLIQHHPALQRYGFHASCVFILPPANGHVSWLDQYQLMQLHQDRMQE